MFYNSLFQIVLRVFILLVDKIKEVNTMQQVEQIFGKGL